MHALSQHQVQDPFSLSLRIMAQATFEASTNLIHTTFSKSST